MFPTDSMSNYCLLISHNNRFFSYSLALRLSAFTLFLTQLRYAAAQPDNPEALQQVRLNPQLFAAIEDASNQGAALGLDEEINALISQHVYDPNTTPVYYDGTHTQIALDQFTRTSKFQAVQQQLRTIEEKLITWLRQHPIELENKFSDPRRPGSEAQTFDAIQTLQQVLNEFQQVAQDGDQSRFIQEKALLWSQTKKQLEQMTALLYTDHIAVSHKHAALLDLLSDNALFMCAAGCIEHFRVATQSLQSAYRYSNFKSQWRQWIRDFVQNAVNHVSSQQHIAIPLTYSKMLCALSGITFTGNERHAKALLLEEARKQYPILYPSSDPLIHLFDHIDAQQKTEVIQRYLSDLNRQITPTQLTQFLAPALHAYLNHLIQTEENAGKLYTQANIILESIGSDPEFSLSEIINTEADPLTLNTVEILHITLAERLIQHGDLQLPETLNVQALQFGRPLPGAIHLAWIKVDNERRPLIIALQDNHDGANLQQRLDTLFPQRAYPLDPFIGSVQDFDTLIRAIPTLIGSHYEGKIIICAVMRKLVHIIYGVLKSNCPFTVAI